MQRAAYYSKMENSISGANIYVEEEHVETLFITHVWYPINMRIGIAHVQYIIAGEQAALLCSLSPRNPAHTNKH